jgi:NADH-ubiquinone oxidoreductase chain 3
MTSTTFFIIFIPILAILLLSINLLLAPHNPYLEKDSVFECGFHSFLGQNRTQFSISFFIFGLLFLLFDLEILLVYPYSVSSYTNDIYGLVVMMVFFVLLTLGFVFELGKNALTIDSRQTSSNSGVISTTHGHVSVVPVLGPNTLTDLLKPGFRESIFFVALLYKDRNLLVPVRIKDAEDFEFDLRLPILSFTAPHTIDNTEELSLLAIEEAKNMFKHSDFCNCNFKS